ncbi:MAG: 3-isopropylmalate dehydrogenase [Parvibaculaceae bacterium]
MAVKRLLILPGDGIGTEILVQTRRVVDWFIARRGLDVDLREELFGIPAWRAHGSLMRNQTWAEIEAADAILFGATGSPEYDTLPVEAREGHALMRMRVDLNLFINLRPVRAHAPLAAVSPLRPEILRGTNLVIVRELTGGLYIGKPRGIETIGGVRRGVNTMTYDEPEIERIARAAFELARTRSGKVCSVDKSNVLETSRLWREVVQALHDTEYSDTELSHLFVDNAAMQLVRAPAQFDVMLMENLFGDILSDIGAAVAGSIGMLPSASMNGMHADGTARHRALYEPIHGSAPDIAGKGIANPCGAILSFAMCLRHTFLRPDDAALLEDATIRAIESGARTADIALPGRPPVSTVAMGDAILRELDAVGSRAAARLTRAP